MGRKTTLKILAVDEGITYLTSLRAGGILYLPRYTQNAPLFKAGMKSRLRLNNQESPALRRGVTGFTADSAENALPIIKEIRPDIVLLDMNLPNMSGLFARLIRK